MADDPRVRHCSTSCSTRGDAGGGVRDCPELLSEVRARWRQVCRLRAELDALFPSPTGSRARPRRRVRPRARRCREVPGYEVEGVLGRGGMGVVYRAWHLRLNRPVALKMLLAGACAEPAERERFRREAEAVAGLRPPQRRAGLRRRRGGRPALLHDGTGRGRQPGRADRRGAPQPARQAAAPGGDAGRRHPRGPPERHRAPRPQAGATSLACEADVRTAHGPR